MVGTYRVVGLCLLVGTVAFVAGLKVGEGRRSGSPTSAQPATASAACEWCVGTRLPDSEKAGPAPKVPTNSGRPCLALFGSKQSAPSKELELVVKEVETRFKGKLDVVRVDAGVYPDEAARWRLRMVPTLIFFDRNSKELWRHEGRLSANELVSKLKSAGVKFRE